jgi:N-carbamoylputrescine amidase
MRLALAQIAPRLGDLEANREAVARVLAQACTHGAELVVFPELALSGYRLGGVGRETACTLDALAPLAEAASETSMLLGFHERDGDHTYNSAAYFERGSLVHVHRKLHLPQYLDFEEASLFSPGQTLRAFDTAFGRAATLICGDAWEPGLPFVAVHDGARILYMPANSATQLEEVEPYWRDMTRLYARLLQCYVVFVNRVGDEDGFTFWGGSHVVDPLGEVLGEAPRLLEELLVVDIEPALADERRAALPLVREGRLDVLQSECERLRNPAAGRPAAAVSRLQ